MLARISCRTRHHSFVSRLLLDAILSLPEEREPRSPRAVSRRTRALAARVCALGASARSRFLRAPGGHCRRTTARLALVADRDGDSPPIRILDADRLRPSLLVTHCERAVTSKETAELVSR